MLEAANERAGLYSQWTDATRAFAEAGYSDEYYEAKVMGKPT